MTNEKGIPQSIKTSFIDNLYNNKDLTDEEKATNSKHAQRVIDRVEKPYLIFPHAFTNKSIVDIGCYLGDRSYILKMMDNDVTAYNINPEIKDALEFTSKIAGFKVEYNFDTIKQNYYDTVFCSSVINLQEDPVNWFLTLLDLDFRYMILIYHDDMIIPMHDDTSSNDLQYESVVTKNDLLALIDNRFEVIEKDAYWDDPVNDINYRKTMLILEKKS